MEFSSREIPFEKCVIKGQIWDTAGQERMEKMTRAYFRDSVGAMLVYDVTNPDSFENLKKLWITQLMEYGHEKMSIVLGKDPILPSCDHQLTSFMQLEIRLILPHRKEEYLP